MRIRPVRSIPQGETFPLHVNFFYLFPLLVLPFPFAGAACNQICGSTRVPYPFGFSSDCPIPFNCSRVNASSTETRILIGEFPVLNISHDTLLIDVPPACDRPIHDAMVFFGDNYAMTTKNALLLRKCATRASGCVISTDLLARRFNLRSCGNESDSISCYSTVEIKGFVSWDYVNKSGCEFLFSALAYDSDKTSYQFRTVELGWWLDGNCSQCSTDAICTLPMIGKQSFTCRCRDGFEGDGFAAGSSCQKALPSSCSVSQYISGSCGSSATRIGLLIGGIVAGAMLVVCMVTFTIIIRRRSTSKSSTKFSKRLLSEASCSVPLYTYKEMERATDGFSDTNRLGTGAYGTVYAGKLHGDELVAIKRIRHRETDSIEQVINEIKLISSVSHPNLVRLLGCCLERGEQILVYEFMANGTLSQHLHRERGRGLPWAVRLTIATETAKAVAHLHSAIHTPIYHRDVKSSNILLDCNLNPKVADFGLSRMVMGELSHISTAPQGTPGYLDPQYHQNFQLSDKSDVYSFGVVLVEILTGLKVVDFDRVQSEINLASLAIDKIGRGCLEDIIDPFLEANGDAWILSSIHRVAELAFRCLAYHRDMRPSMLEVAEELEQVRQSDGSALVSSISSQFSSLSDDTDKLRETPSNTRSIGLMTREEVGGNSPASVQDPWLRGQLSPSTNNLLGNVKVPR